MFLSVFVFLLIFLLSMQYITEDANAEPCNTHMVSINGINSANVGTNGDFSCNYSQGQTFFGTDGANFAVAHSGINDVGNGMHMDISFISANYQDSNAYGNQNHQTRDKKTTDTPLTLPFP
jgi:hypothetical protein